MDKRQLGNWIRQSRHKAKPFDVINKLEIDDLFDILKIFDKCAYCGSAHKLSFDHQLQFKDGAPNAPCNVLPICKPCKSRKKNNDIIWMYSNNYIPEQLYLEAIKHMVSQEHGDIQKSIFKKLIGI